jgi:hypothetical protein
MICHNRVWLNFFRIKEVVIDDFNFVGAFRLHANIVFMHQVNEF